MNVWVCLNNDIMLTCLSQLAYLTDIVVGQTGE